MVCRSLQCLLVKRWVEPIRTAALPHRALLLCCWQLATHMLYQLRRNGLKMLLMPMSEKPTLHTIMLGQNHCQTCSSVPSVCDPNQPKINKLNCLDSYYSTLHTCIYMSMVPNIRGAQLCRLIFPMILLNTFLK